VKLYGVAEIAMALGVDRRKVAMWRTRGKLPPPTQVLSTGPVWTAADIEPWIADQIERRG